MRTTGTATATAWRLVVLPVLVAMAMVLLTPDNVSAHERRALAGGRYAAVVGMLTEPAYDGQMNGVDLTVTDESQKGVDGKGTPLMGAEKTLFVEISVPSGAKQELALRARGGMPGKYAATFLPTAPGSYTFRLYGAIGDARVDERFENRVVNAATEVQFPAKAGATDMQAQLAAARSEATTARTLGIAGLVVGTLGLAAGGAALARRPGRMSAR